MLANARRGRALLSIVTMSLIGISVPATQAVASPSDVIVDPVLRDTLDPYVQPPLAVGTPISETQLATVTAPVMAVPNIGITNLAGMQFATGLRRFTFYFNGVSDLSPLSSLTELQLLDFQNNRVVDLSPISGLVKLTYLNAGANNVSDVSALAGMTSLDFVTLVDNHIADMTPLAGSSPASRGLDGQHVEAGTAFVPVGATSFVMTSANAMLKNIDGTRPEITAGAGYVSALSNVTWDSTALTPSSTQLSFNFHGNGGRNGGVALPSLDFSGDVTWDIVRVDFTNANPGDGTVGTHYETNFTITTGFNPSYSLIAGDVPGLSFDQAAGALVGTPTRPGDFPVTIRGTDVNGNSIDHSYTIHIGAVPPSTPTPSPTPTAVVPVNPTSSASPPSASGSLPSSLPDTGSSTPLLASIAFALVFVLLGLVLVGVARSRKRGSSRPAAELRE